MRFKQISISALAAIFLFSCNTNNKMNKTAYQWPKNVAAPASEKIPKQLTAHGDTITDNYYWLNDYFKQGPNSKKVVTYLEVENKYFDTMMAGTKALQDKLYTEMKARIKEDDESVPVYKNGYYYYTRVVAGKDYFVYCRKKGTLTAKEEILLDVNAIAEGHNYFSANGFSVSTDNKLLAYGVDKVSRRQYTIYIKNLETGKLLKDEIKNTEGDPVWANDSKTFFYTS